MGCHCGGCCEYFFIDKNGKYICRENKYLKISEKGTQKGKSTYCIWGRRIAGCY